MSTQTQGGRLQGMFSRSTAAVTRIACRLAGCEESTPTSESPVQLHQIGTAPPAGPVAAPTGRIAVKADRLTKVYPGDVTGAEEVSIQARTGEIVAVVGPNGSGKSTTLNMLAGLLRPTGGTAEISGVRSTDVKRLGKVLGVALQTSGLDPAMTANEHFEVQGALYGMGRRLTADCAAGLLEMFGLDAYADRQVAQFSVGLQRRLVLALSMLHDPSVIILDEPTAGLDPQSRRMVWKLMEQARHEGRTILFSTQLLEEADVLAQRLYVIDGGRVVAEGPPSELRESYGELTLRVRVSGALDEAAALLAAGLPGLGTARQDGDCLVFSAVSSGEEAGRVAAVLGDSGVELLEVSVGRPSLEDAFVRLTGSAIRPEPLVTAGGGGGTICRCS